MNHLLFFCICSNIRTFVCISLNFIDPTTLDITCIRGMHGVLRAIISSEDDWVLSPHNVSGMRIYHLGYITIIT
jgi:hypothetical protein